MLTHFLFTGGGGAVYEDHGKINPSAVFETRVHDIVGRHLGGVPIVHTMSRESSGGRYLSVTCTIEAVSREQLDSIYLDLHSEVDILVTL